MKRLTLAAAIVTLTGGALAMPSDLPWEVYACREDKGLQVKFLSDGMAIGVKVGGDEPSEFTFVPQSDAQAGFKDGAYNAEGGAVLTLKTGLISISGETVEGAPYDSCAATGVKIEPN